MRMRCVPAILRLHNARLGAILPGDELDDVVQDTLAALWKKLPGYAGDAKLETWAYRFCVLELRGALRRRRNRPRALPETAPDVQEPEAEPEVASVDYEDLHESLARLTPAEERAVRLKHFSHLTFEEAAERLDVSPNTVKTRYYRALGRLRTFLAPRREVTRR